MSAKRLNIMLYSQSSGEQIILPVNPERIELKYENKLEEFDILNFGKICLTSHINPIKITLSNFLPEDDSPFAKNASIVYSNKNNTGFSQYAYSQVTAVVMLKEWTEERKQIRLVIDDEINAEFLIVSFSQTIRENTLSKPYVIELAEYKNPALKRKNYLGLITRGRTANIPDNLVLKAVDTVYSVADKYGLDFKKLAQNNGIKNVNANLTGKTISLKGAIK